MERRKKIEIKNKKSWANNVGNQYDGKLYSLAQTALADMQFFLLKTDR